MKVFDNCFGVRIASTLRGRLMLALQHAFIVLADRNVFSKGTITLGAGINIGGYGEWLF